MNNLKLLAVVVILGLTRGRGDQELGKLGPQHFGLKLLQHANGGKVYDLTTNNARLRSLSQVRTTNIEGHPEVNTTSGVAIGTTTENSHSFYEIPYAVPPVGPLRFGDPQPLLNLNSQINATVNNHLKCLQYSDTCSGTGNTLSNSNENEDCLVLNVFVPKSVGLLNATVQSPQLPVMFYIHGGSFRANAGTDNGLDGKELANVTNSIVVTINYRLGSLGFLVHQEDGEVDITGNQGLKDQRLAMRWVQDNIAAFGGNRNKVMLFGNSAGGQSVMFHTISAESAPLFSNSIQQSNPHIFSLFYPDMDASVRITQRLLKALGCDTSSATERECLMATPAKDIIGQMCTVENLTAFQENNVVYAEETFMPVIDSVEFEDQPEILYRDGKWNKDKPTIIGVNTEETAYFQFLLEDPMLEEEFRELNRQSFGDGIGDIVSDRYLEAYPGKKYSWIYSEEVANYFFDCPSRLMARYASNTSTSKVYFYANSHPAVDYYCAYLYNGTTGCRFAYHASEIPYVFRTLDEAKDYTEDDQIVENEFSTYWGSFARTKNPSNGLDSSLGNFTDWLEYSELTVPGSLLPWSNLHISSPSSEMQYKYEEALCNFWDGINYGRNYRPEETTSTTNRSTLSSTSVPTTSDATSHEPGALGLLACLAIKCAVGALSFH